MMSTTSRGARWKILDDGLPIHVDDLMGCWRKLLGLSPPWGRMARLDVDGQMPRILSELLDVSGGRNEAARRRRLTAASYAHGTFRGVQGCSVDSLDSEFMWAAGAIQVTLANAGFATALARDVVSWLNPELSLARTVAIRGLAAHGLQELAPR